MAKFCNAYFLAKFRFDTAENEPAKNLQNFARYANFADPNPLAAFAGGDDRAVRDEDGREHGPAVLHRRHRSPDGFVGHRRGGAR